jgi:hypothetical protein
MNRDDKARGISNAGLISDRASLPPHVAQALKVLEDALYRRQAAPRRPPADRRKMASADLRLVKRHEAKAR